jgi:hypothetical protein
MPSRRSVPTRARISVSLVALMIIILAAVVTLISITFENVDTFAHKTSAEVFYNIIRVLAAPIIVIFVAAIGFYLGTRHRRF